MRFWTAQYRYPGPDRLDITVKGKDPVGRFFAPTWKMVQDLKKGVTTIDEYTAQYHQMITNLYNSRPDVFKALLEKDQVILVCFCPHGAFCHRQLLSEYLIQLGAEYMGEIVDFTPWTKKKAVIDSFKGDYHWLSNFAHCKFTHEGQLYLSVEHLYQAYKATPDAEVEVPDPADPQFKIQVNAREYIATCENPKKAVRKLKIPLPDNWENDKVAIMRIGLEYKFLVNVHYRKLLADTGDAAIIEGNYWHDNFWGDCNSNREGTGPCPKCFNINGLNVLGNLLIEMRNLINKEKV